MISPPDYIQGDSVRIMYVHVPSSFIAIGCFGFIGKKYDVIVDSYQNPRSIIGVVEKPGKIMIELDSQAKQNIESTRAIITRDKN